MKRPEIRVIGGVLLIVFGVLSLLQTLGILTGIVDLLWTLLFGAGGLLFLYSFLTNNTNVWALIPGFVLLSLAALMGLNQFAPAIGEAWGGTLILGGVGLAFWAIYLVRREHWWAVIPGGVLVTLALVTGLSSVLEGVEIGGIFLLGLGATFGLLSWLPTPEGRMKWALIPATVLVVMGLLVTAAAEELIGYLWPAVLILSGLYLIWRVS